MHYWCQFIDDSKGTINADSIEQLHEVAAKLKKPIKHWWPLPYPASPQLNPGNCPPFCFTPERCKGHSSCPRNYACSE